MSASIDIDKKILKVIDKCSYEMYGIKRDLEKKCRCVEHGTAQADPDCPRCLGTGHKITIKKVFGAAQDSKSPPTFRTDKLILAREFYLKTEFDLVKNDLIVDNGVPFFIMEQQEQISLEGKIPYKKLSGIRKKFDTKVFMNNFNNIIRARK